MSETCGVPYPKDELITCEKPTHPWGYHFNLSTGTVWEGLEPPTKVKDKTRAKKVIGSIKPDPKIGPPVSPLRPTRSTDPETSHDAAASTTEDALRRTQMDVLGLFQFHGAMSDEDMIARGAAAGIKQSTSGMRTRRSELVAMGYLVDSGLKGRTKTGRNTILWITVEEAQ